MEKSGEKKVKRGLLVPQAYLNSNQAVLIVNEKMRTWLLLVEEKVHEGERSQRLLEGARMNRAMRGERERGRNQEPRGRREPRPQKSE